MPAAAAPFLLVALAGAGAAAAAAQSNAKNKAVRKSAEAAKKAADVQTTQLERQAVVEREKIRRESEAIRARLAVSTAETGIGFGDTYSALERQSVNDREYNLGVLNENLDSNIARVRSGLEANLAELNNYKSNSLLAAFSGGISGAQTGISFASLGREMGEAGTTGVSEQTYYSGGGAPYAP